MKASLGYRLLYKLIR